MRIIHISYSKSGGAGRVAQMLSHQMVKMGHQSSFVYLSNSNLARNFLRSPLIFVSAIIDNYVFRSRSGKSLFSITRGNFKSKINFSSFDVIHLHWTPGIFSFNDLLLLSQMGKKIIWTLHDMWPFTGGCHHSFNCQKFTIKCDHCPQVKKPFRLLIKNNLKKKGDFLDKKIELNITAPSSWLIEKSKISQLFRKYEHSKIFNPIEDVWFLNKIDATRIIEVINKSRKLVLGFSALNANIESKGIYDYINNFNSFKSQGVLNYDFEFLIIGEFSKSHDFENLSISGTILDEGKLIDEYRKIDIFINPSFSENSPVNIVEAGALGIPCIVRKTGGMPELIKDGVNGFTFETINESAVRINQLLELDFYVNASEDMHKSTKNSHSVSEVTGKFLNLYLD
jgi:glycosyltransferase involved in cell wall biosynthesis